MLVMRDGVNMREPTNATGMTDPFVVETSRASQSTRPPCPTSAEVIPALVERIVRDFEPVQIILFGSQARGEARWDSDVDLLVVLPSAPDKHKAAVAIRRALHDIPVAKDIIVSTPDEIARYGDMVGRILRPAHREGRGLHTRAGRWQLVKNGVEATFAFHGSRYF